MDIQCEITRCTCTVALQLSQLLDQKMRPRTLFIAPELNIFLHTGSRLVHAVWTITSPIAWGCTAAKCNIS